MPGAPDVPELVPPDSVAPELEVKALVPGAPEVPELVPPDSVAPELLVAREVDELVSSSSPVPQANPMISAVIHTSQVTVRSRFIE